MSALISAAKASGFLQGCSGWQDPNKIHLALQAFPVTEEVEQAGRPGHEFHVLGVIERKAILKMLQHHIGFCAAAGSCENLPAQRPQLTQLLSRFEQRPLKVDTDADQTAILR